MENINASQVMQPVAYQGTLKRNTDNQKATSPTQQKEHNPAKIALTLACLAAAGGAVVYGIKTGKLQTAVDTIKSKLGSAKTNEVTELVPVKPNVVSDVADDISKKAADALKDNKAAHAAQTVVEDVSKKAADISNKTTTKLLTDNKTSKMAQKAADSAEDLGSKVNNSKVVRPYEDGFVGPLKKFTKNTTEPGTYISDAGYKVAIDKNGTGIVDYGNGKYIVTTSGGHQQYVDAKYGVKEDYSLLDTCKRVDTKKQNAQDSNIMHILDVKYKKAQKLMAEFEKNPTKKTAKQLLKLAHSDEFQAEYLDNASDAIKEKCKAIEDIYKKASIIKKEKLQPVQGTPLYYVS